MNHFNLKPFTLSYSIFLFCLLIYLFPTACFASLDRAYIGGQVDIQGSGSSSYVRAEDGQTLVVSSNSSGLFNHFSRWVIELVPGTTDTYTFRRSGTGIYMTISSQSGIEEGILAQQTRYSGVLAPLQEFTFVKQTSGSNRYKIRTAFTNGAGTRFYVLAFPEDLSSNNIPLEVQLNQQTGNDQHQQFDIGFVGDQSELSGFQSNNLAIVQNDVYLGAWHLRSNADKIIWNINEDGYLVQQVENAGIDYSNNSIFLFIKDPENSNRFRIQHKGTKKFLTLEVGNAGIADGIPIKLADYMDSEDQLFFFEESIRLISRWGIAAHNVGNNVYYLEPAGDGQIRLKSRDVGSFSTSTEWKRSEISWVLSEPDKGALEPFYIMNKKTGHTISDNGINANNTAVTHNDISNYPSVWHFEKQANGFYFIKNALTGNYLTTRYGGGFNNELKTTVDRIVSGNHNYWEVTKNIGRYNIRSVATSFYLVTNTEETPESPVRLGGISAGGSKWVIMPVLQDEIELEQGDYDGILDSDPIPKLCHPLNNLNARIGLLQLIGLPGNPEDGSNYPNPNWNSLGVDPSVSFFTVLKDAIDAYYATNNNAPSTDLILSEYFNADSTGHRVEMAFILRKYILEDLVQKGRVNWTSDETELVEYLERQIEEKREDYGQRIEDSWEEHKEDQQIEGPPVFSDLISFTTEKGYIVPEEFIHTDNEYGDLMEYQHVAISKGFRNPNGNLETIFTNTSTIGAHLLIGFFGNTNFLNTLATKASEKAFAAGLKGVGRISDDLAEIAVEQTLNSTVKSVKLFKNLGAAANVASIVTTTIEILVRQTMDVVEFIEFENRLNSKIFLLNQSVNVVSIQNGNNEMDRLSLYYYLDNILGARYPSAVNIPTCPNTTRLYVDNLAGAPTNKGTGWQDALSSLADALFYAEQCGIAEIWVKGVNTSGMISISANYYPDKGISVTENDRKSTFIIPAGVSIYGGFIGTETTIAQRNLEDVTTILSGEIQQDDDHFNNAYNVVTFVDGGTSVIDGFTIQDGFALNTNVSSTDINNSGGGVAIATTEDAAITSLTFLNCKIRNNFAIEGAGGIDIRGQKSITLELVNCLVTGNRGKVGGIKVHSNNLENASIILGVSSSTVTANQSDDSSLGANIDFGGDNSVGEQNLLIANNSIIYLSENHFGPPLNSLRFDATGTSVNLFSVCINSSVDLSGITTLNLIIQDPSFKSMRLNAPTTQGNYLLNNDSPLINAGLSGGTTRSFDINNNSRIVGSQTDIGAYEVQDETLTLCEINELLLNESISAVETNYRVASKIESNAELSTNAVVSFIAGESITLKPGFSTEPGVQFTARIEDCNEEELYIESVALLDQQINPKPTSELQDLALKVYPNPTSFSANIDYFMDQEGPITLALFDVNGQLLKVIDQGQIASGWKYFNLDVSQFSSGVYFVQLYSPTGIINKRLVVARG